MKRSFKRLSFVLLLFTTFLSHPSLIFPKQRNQTHIYLPLTSRPFLATVTTAYTYGTSQYSFQILAEVANISFTESLSVTIQTVSRPFSSSTIITSTALLKPIVSVIPPQQRIPAIVNGINPGIEILDVKILRTEPVSELNIAPLTVRLEKIERVFDIRCVVYGTISNQNAFAVTNFTAAVWMFAPETFDLALLCHLGAEVVYCRLW
jgi:hypothetical protein